MRALAAQAAHALDAAQERGRLEKAVRRAERAEAELSRRVEAQSTEIEGLRESLVKDGDQSALRGHSAAMDRLRHSVARVASAQLPVLVRGESGTGKELVARALHDESPRRERAFVSENCAALPETLLESTLFGHVRGAFTGASSGRVGLFEMAHRGTLFLDEIGEMSLAMQAKLLRVLETGEFYPVGSEKQKRVDVRVVAATHRDLEALVREGTFRQDLLFRLAVVELHVPPLRERTEDIPLLVAHFFAKYEAPKGLKVSPAALARLAAYAWPGNVRQLENELRKQIVFATDVVEVSDLAPAIQESASTSRGGGPSPTSERGEESAEGTEVAEVA
ncbi:sigma-54-dependent Fis family transcriptional regulator, partial [bacterium]